MTTLRSRPLSRDEWTGTALTVGCVALTLFLLAVFLMPGGHAREPAYRIKCSSNLRQIGLAAKMYAAENNGVYPMTFGPLVATQEITTDVFLCPQSNDDRATTDVPTGPGPTTRGSDPALVDLARKLDDPAGHHCSYLWAGDGMKDDEHTNADWVLAFEDPARHASDGANVLFADGHVDWAAVGLKGPTRDAFERFMADYRAGKRPLLCWQQTTP